MQARTPGAQAPSNLPGPGLAWQACINHVTEAETGRMWQHLRRHRGGRARVASVLDPGRGAAQGLLCGVLQVIVQRLSEADTNKAAVLQYADSMMEARRAASRSLWPGPVLVWGRECLSEERAQCRQVLCRGVASPVEQASAPSCFVKACGHAQYMCC